MSEQWHEQERERALAELRVHSLELRLALAHVDQIGLLLRDGLMQPWDARAALASLLGEPEGSSE